MQKLVSYAVTRRRSARVSEFGEVDLLSFAVFGLKGLNDPRYSLASYGGDAARAAGKISIEELRRLVAKHAAAEPVLPPLAIELLAAHAPGDSAAEARQAARAAVMQRLAWLSAFVSSAEAACLVVRAEGAPGLGRGSAGTKAGAREETTASAGGSFTVDESGQAAWQRR